jgi:hypothetical protein
MFIKISFYSTYDPFKVDHSSSATKFSLNLSHTHFGTMSHLWKMYNQRLGSVWDAPFSCLYTMELMPPNISGKHHCPKSFVNVLPSKRISPVWLFTLLIVCWPQLWSTEDTNNVGILQPPDILPYHKVVTMWVTTHYCLLYLGMAGLHFLQ